MIQQLWIWKWLIQLTKTRASYHLLAHHQVISWLSVLLFLTLDVSHSIPRHSGIHHALAPVLSLWPTLFLFWLIFGHWPWTFNSLNVLSILAARFIVHGHIDLIWKNLVLFCIPSDHHIGLLEASAIHYDVVVVLFNNCYSTVLVSYVLLGIVGLVLSIILIGWHHSSAKDLWVLNLDLGVVEDVIVVVDVLYNFDWLGVSLLLRLWRSIPPCVHSTNRLVCDLIWIGCLLTSLLLLVLLITYSLFHLNSIIICIILYCSLTSLLWNLLGWLLFVLVQNLINIVWLTNFLLLVKI